jgi:2-hydroxychromene-2-carboxylate isomerase
MTKQIDYFFGIGSPWAYIGFDAFRALAARFDVTIIPHVIPLVEENGGIFSRNRPEPRRNYWTKDLKRWAAYRGKTLNFENRTTLSDPGPAALAVIAAYLDGQDWARLAEALQAAFWGEARDIGSAGIRATIAQAAGFDAAALEKRIAAKDVLDRWSSSYEIARQAGVFGFPTFRYEGELYWGQDSLPFLERHLSGEALLA